MRQLLILSLLWLFLCLFTISAKAGLLLQVDYYSDGALGDRGPVALGFNPPPANDKLRSAQKLLLSEKNEEAFQLLSKNLESFEDKDQKGLALFSLGVLSYKMNKDTDAQSYLSQAFALGTRVNDYVNYYMGLSLKRSGEFAKARLEFNRVLDSKAPQATQLEARLELGEIAFQEKNYKAALTQYRYLQRRLKNTQHYPEVLWGLLRAEKKVRGRAAGCRWAKDLFSKYPSAPEVREWTADLSRNKVDGENVGCGATTKDMQSRIRRLQWGGEADRALQELKAMQGRLGAEEYSLDALIANHYINEGRTDEALRILMKYYEGQKNRPGYLLLLAKAASRAGDFQAAVGAYYRAYQMAPRSKNSRNALFQAAFMSYQFQDYDGATKKFEQFVKTFPTSKLVRDCRWHLAWIRYLKGDYSGAYTHFQKLPTKTTIRRGRRKRVIVEAMGAERVKYWSAMALLKMGKAQEAIPLFLKLARDPAIGYYSVASYYRLATIPASSLKGEVNLAKKAALEGAGQMSEDELLNAALQLQEEEAAEKTESEETVTADAGDAATDVAEKTEGAGEEGEAEPEADPVTLADSKDVNFNDVFLAKRFERARDLVTAGLEEFARRELLEIEKRTRSAADRRTLMQEYQLVQNYYRSSYIGETYFGVQRLRGGIQGARQFWEYAFPRAYENTVVANARTFNVPEELIWGIMKQESHFRKEAQSPVGAMGLMQLMPFTARNVGGLLGAKDFEPRQLGDPEVNIRFGSRYLQRLLEKFSTSIPLVAAGYNAGPHRVASWLKGFGTLEMDEFIEHIPFVETRNYVKKVVRNVQVYGLLYSNSGRTLKWLVRPVGVQVDDATPINEVW